MGEGLGAIRVKLRTARTGHELRFENRHLPQVSVYLANCLAAPSDRLVATRQKRDEVQRSIEFEYSFSADGAASGVDGAGAILAGRDRDAAGGPDVGTYLQSETRRESIQILT